MSYRNAEAAPHPRGSIGVAEPSDTALLGTPWELYGDEKLNELKEPPGTGAGVCGFLS